MRHFYGNISKEVLECLLSEILMKLKQHCCDDVYRWNDLCLASAFKKQIFYGQTKIHQSDISSNTLSASPTKHFKSAYSEATLKNFMNKMTGDEIAANLKLWMVILTVQ